MCTEEETDCFRGGTTSIKFCVQGINLFSPEKIYFEIVSPGTTLRGDQICHDRPTANDVETQDIIF